MQPESIELTRDVLAAYVDEQIAGLGVAERRVRLAELRLELAREIDANQWSEQSAAEARAFLAGFDAAYPVEPEPPAPVRPVNRSRAVRRGILATMPRLMLIMMSLMGAARTGGVRHVGVAVVALVVIFIARSAYLSARAAGAS